MKRWILASALLAAGCGALHGGGINNPFKPPPPPVAVWWVDVIACRLLDPCDPIAGAAVQIHKADGYSAPQVTDENGYTVWAVPSTLVDSDVIITANGYATLQGAHLDVKGTHDGQKHNEFLLARSFPPVPSRNHVLSSFERFQGLMIHQTCAEPNDLPWFDAALFSPQLAACRGTIFQQKRQAGDSAAIILFYGDDKSIYDEANQPFQQFTAGDFEHHLEAFVAAVVDTIDQGFTPWIYLQGDGPCCFDAAMRQFPIAHAALANTPYGDLNAYVQYRPGWDSVFYGWEPSHQKIPAFAALVRSLCPQCYLGLEFNTGHIPIGEGGSDYAMPNGDMLGYDVLDVEFHDGNVHDDNTWQILARLLGPAYRRPSDQPAGDDPNPAWYLRDGTPRGLWYVNCFEFAEYEWVRKIFDAQRIAADRQYLSSVGCPVVF